ncbi:(2Fe-2S)-binding protein [Evansella halocellulosilytica]|uniref:(2Fe-2S)-binding protein n=1 Tax=Evansella halocellulosilytica TaxID=2011013 RepID=UPI000BB67ED4|nr:(2Fe-2S)-binding protein [Evansella halocellulosilytica]
MTTNEKTIICRCEEVSLQEIEQTIETYRCSSREIKLRTRAGMGYCGGRTCRHLIESIIQHYNHESINYHSPLKHQPPVRPISFHTKKVNFHD